MKVADVIKAITKKHLEEDNGLLFGQSVTAVGWINGTVPDVKNIVELPMTDVAASGFAVGAALVGRRPIFVLRFQNFFTINCSQLINYAAISKELFEQGVPVFIRCIGSDGAGPAHSGILHNIPMYFPGFRVAAPMTPEDYEEVWQSFMREDVPYFVSEHRNSYANEENWKDEICEGAADLTIYAVSDARSTAREAVKKLREIGVRVNLVHVLWLKPFDIERMRLPLCRSRAGLVADIGFPTCGAARDLAYQLTERTRIFVKAVSAEDRVKCLHPKAQNGTPDSSRIFDEAVKLLGTCSKVSTE